MAAASQSLSNVQPGDRSGRSNAPGGPQHPLGRGLTQFDLLAGRRLQSARRAGRPRKRNWWKARPPT